MKFSTIFIAKYELGFSLEVRGALVHSPVVNLSSTSGIPSLRFASLQPIYKDIQLLDSDEERVYFYNFIVWRGIKPWSSYFVVF